MKLTGTTATRSIATFERSLAILSCDKRCTSVWETSWKRWKCQNVFFGADFTMFVVSHNCSKNVVLTGVIQGCASSGHGKLEAPRRIH